MVVIRAFAHRRVADVAAADHRPTMGQKTVTVTTAARLHFGPLAWKSGGPAFGGLGMMVRGPGLTGKVVASPDRRWSVEADDEDVRRRVESLTGRLRDRDVAPCRITVAKALRPHAGLGSGTQLAAGVADACVRAGGGRVRDVATMAGLTGRGQRSWLGLHGYLDGGLMLDAGRVGDAGVLASRVACPGVMLLALDGPAGMSGGEEEGTFRELPPMPAETTGRLCDLAVRHVIAGAAGGDFALFADGLTEYGLIAGDFFKTSQGGRFADPAWEDRLEATRACGHVAVVQSSWGPAVAVICEDEATAGRVREACPDVTFQTAEAVPPSSRPAG